MLIVFIVLLGLCMGSFANALAWRLHQKRDWVKERSECVHCHHKLAWNDLIPVVSWLMLRGKCRYCKKPISPQYPAVELITATLFLISYVWWPYLLSSPVDYLHFCLWLAILVVLVVITIYDLRWMVIPNRLVYVLGGLSLAMIAAQQGAQEPNIDGIVLGGLAVGGLFYLLFQVSGGRWIGGGDVKLGVVLGMLAGSFAEGLLLVFIASLIGTLAALPLLAMNKKTITQKLPFGPFLIAATIIVYLFGQSMVDWYQSLILA